MLIGKILMVPGIGAHMVALADKLTK